MEVFPETLWAVGDDAGVVGDLSAVWAFELREDGSRTEFVCGGDVCSSVEVELVDHLHLGAGGPEPDVLIGRLATASVPEPATLALLGLSLVGLGYVRQRKA